MPNKPLVATSLVSPGFLGLNSQDSGVSMDQSFALTATNAIIDKSGRIAARNGWSYRTTSGGTSSNPEALFEFDNGDGTYTMIACGNNKLFTGETTMTEKTVRNSTNTGDLTYTITANNWQIVQSQYEAGTTASAHAYLVQAGYPVLMYHKLGATAHAHTGAFGFQRLGDIGSVPSGYTTTTFTPNCALAAYGRTWFADVANNNNTIYYSVLLDGDNLSGVGSGYINLEQVLPGGDKIVALAEHNNFLIVFCERNIVIYSNANDIDNLMLSDVIVGVGCISRDSIQKIGTDILFLSNSGIRSIGRTIQEKSAPVRDISRNVRDQLLAYVATENLDNIKSAYHEADAIYLLTMPGSNLTFCFDLKQFFPDGSSRATVWDSIDPSSLCVTHDRRLLLGKTDGIARYTGYTDNGSTYNFAYYTPYLDFGSPSVTKMLKKIVVTVFGASNTALEIRWAFDYLSGYKSAQIILPTTNIAEYGIAEYNIGEYSISVPYEQIKKQLSGNGNIVQIGIEAVVSGSAISIQKLDIYAVTGRTI